MSKRKSSDTSGLYPLIEKIQQVLGIKSTHNTNEDVDVHVFRASQKGDEYSMNWLICQFCTLIVQTATKKIFHKPNAYSGARNSYVFDELLPEDIEDLVMELIIHFKECVEEYNWSTAFNSWIKGRLEWYAINYHMRNNKHHDRERCTLDNFWDCKDHDFTGEDSINQLSEEKGMWNVHINARQRAHNNQLEMMVRSYAETHFTGNKLLIYKMFFVEGLNMSDIAIKLRYGYHSTVSNIVKEIRSDLQVFLSKIDEDFDAAFERVLEKEQPTGPAELILLTDEDFSIESSSVDEIEEPTFEIPTFEPSIPSTPELIVADVPTKVVVTSTVAEKPQVPAVTEKVEVDEFLLFTSSFIKLMESEFKRDEAGHSIRN